MKEIKAPNNFLVDEKEFYIFLAGSIEMGSAEMWQEKIVADLQNYNVTFLNPRRDDWDTSQKHSIKNQYFADQVNWELDALERANLILMYFDPNTKSPISLLELGLHSGSGHIIVCCPDGYWRKGNVEVVCERGLIPMVESIDDLSEVAKNIVTQK